MILYCFITHSKAIEQDLKHIHGMMNDLHYEYYKVFYGGNDLNIIDNHIIHLDCTDTYEGLPNKIHILCKYLENSGLTNQYSHFCKLDSDIKLHTLVPILSQDYYGYVCKDITPPEYRRKYHQGKCSPNSNWNNKIYKGKFVEYCAGGWVVVLSKKSVQCISNNPNDPNHDIYEDLYVGQQLLKYNIKPFHYDTTRLFDGWRN